MRRLSTFNFFHNFIITMTNNNKNTILTSIMALTLLTSAIAVGGAQNAYAGIGGFLECSAFPDGFSEILEAGAEESIIKEIHCEFEGEIIFEPHEFEVFPEVDCEEDGLQIDFEEIFINSEELDAEYDETIRVLDDAEPGQHHCTVRFDAQVFGDVFICELPDGSTIGPLEIEEQFDACLANGGEVRPEPFAAVGIAFQDIWIDVPNTEPEVQHVSVDVRPQSCPNPINTNSKGLIPVAILGTVDLDVTQIDLSSLTINGVSPAKTSFEDVATPHTPDTAELDANDCTEEGADGILDLALKFDIQEILEDVDAPDGDVQTLVVEGQLLDGTPIAGYDVVIFRNK